MNSTKNFTNSSKLLVECLKSEKLESGPMYGQFLIDSLRSGQGITIGNLLRRVLLGDLSGTACQVSFFWGHGGVTLLDAHSGCFVFKERTNAVSYVVIY